MSIAFIRFYFVCKKETRRFLRIIIQTVLAPILNVSLYLLIFGVSIGSRIEMAEGVPYLLFILPGLLMMGMLNNSLQNSAGSIVTSKFNGDLEDLRVVPVNSHQIVWGMSIASLLRGTIVSACIAVTGLIFNYLSADPMITVAHPAWALFFLIIGGLTFAQLGIVIGFYSTTFDQLNMYFQFIVLPLIYLGGVFFSVESLPPFWRSIAYANPLLYLTNGLRGAVLEVSDISLEVCMGVTLSGLALTCALAYWAVVNGSYKKF